MKKVIKNLAMSAVAVIMVVSVSMAQEKGTRTRGERPGVAANLSEEQKALVKANAENLKAGRAALEATFTAEQKEISNNKEIAPMEKRKALAATFTAEQKAIADKNKALAKEGNEKFQNSLTEDQKSAMKDRRQGVRGARKAK